ncbi:fumarylacetoacetate hydrolase family protein [Microbacterium sp. A204]|uniref:fumarylacetoacetate hydrolase family protein n=1 Tax=Microbacterium sp. A204 TaxID=3457321 RepID=UPI003FD06428
MRYLDGGAVRVGVVDDDAVARSLEGVVDDLAGDALAPAALVSLRDVNVAALPVANVDQVLPPVSGTGVFVGVGLNYHAHAEETNLAAPTAPLVFHKATTSISGPFDDVVTPAGSTKLDHEVELAIVIGADAWQVSQADALSVVAGYTICNDVSDRGWQFDGPGQWTIGKSAPTFGPLGPWLVTTDEVGDASGLEISLAVNGEVMQQSNTDQMIFDVARLVEHVSHRMRLHAGDIISTGTPEGVGLVTDRYLKPGDRMELTIDNLGSQSQLVR